MNEWEWEILEAKNPLDELRVSDVTLRPGSRVRLRPRKGGDIMDLALANKTAVIESIEQDYEGKIHLGVVVDDDPGRDIGLMRQPGHRFFFNPDEIEPVLQCAEEKAVSDRGPRILVAGIGNIFLGDDAFGVEVVRRLSARKLPEGVRVADFGIRGFDLACALLDGHETTILVDACPRGEPAGTLFVIEPDVGKLDPPGEQQIAVEAHGMDPVNVLRLAASMGGPLKRVLLVGCEPGTLGPEEGQMGLSEPIQAVIDEAVDLVESLVRKLLGEMDSDPSSANHTQ